MSQPTLCSPDPLHHLLQLMHSVVHSALNKSEALQPGSVMLSRRQPPPCPYTHLNDRGVPLAEADQRNNAVRHSPAW